MKDNGLNQLIKPRKDLGHLDVQFSLQQNMDAATSNEASLAGRAKAQSQFYCNHSCTPKIPTLWRGFQLIVG